MEPVIIAKDNKSKTKPESRMKVLWFTTSPSLSRAKLDGSYNVGTSWIEAMEELVHQYTDIELAIAFIWKTNQIDSFQTEYSSTKYYAMPRRPMSKFINLLRRNLCLPEPDTIINDCLQVVDDFKPDLVHFFGTETPFPLIIPHLKIPHVIWFQGNLTVYHEKWYAGITWWQSLLSENIKDLILAKSELHAYLLNRQFVVREKKIFKNAQNFIGRTDWDKRLVQTMAPQARYFHGDEIMRPVFYQQIWAPHTDRDRYILVSTFRDNLFKGLETAMRAFQILTPLLNKSLEWHIVGVPENSHYDRVCRRISGLPKDSNLKLLGFMSADQIVDQLMQADAFVHPSHIDNSPNSLCEAMLMGLPIVSTNAGGIPSILEDGVEGLLVQNGDEYALAGAILELLRNKELAHSMGIKAREKALVRNDRQKIISEVLDIYRCLKASIPNKDQ
jgi:glycosyltransferase involved in cell wall biosynthesis